MEQNAINLNITTDRYRSYDLTARQISNLRKWLSTKKTIGDASAELGLGRDILPKVIKGGSCGPKTFQAIRQIINA